MSVIRPPVTGDVGLDSWMNDVSKAIVSTSATAITGGTSATGVGFNPVNAVTLVLYKRYSSATLPSSEYITVDTKYTYSTTTLINLNDESTVLYDGWTRSIPDLSGGDYLFAIQVNIADSGATDIIPATDWSDPVLIQTANTAGIDGFNSATVTLYKRNDGATPSNPLGDLTYTFSTASYTRTVTTDGWTDINSLPAGTTLWIATASAVSRDNTHIIPTTEWKITKLSVDGIDGIDGTNGRSTAVLMIYGRYPVIPNAPTGGQFDFSTNTLTPPTGWYTNIPDGDDPVYVSIGLASVVGQSGIDDSIAWDIPKLAFQNGNDGIDGEDGAIGKSLFEGFIFKRSATTPPIPTGGQFDFTNNILTPPVGWFVDIPEGSDPAWLSTALFSIPGDEGVDDTAQWTTPTKSFDNGLDGQPGADGISVYQFNIFQRSAEIPVQPIGGSYDFGNNIASPPPGWYEEIPPGTDPCYVCTTTASVSGPTGVDDSLTWSAVRELVRSGIDGIDGDDGSSNAALTIYLRSPTEPSTPIGGSFNFTTSLLTPPDIPDVWSSSIPPGTDPVWAVNGIASIIGNIGTDTDIAWSSPPVKVFENGVDGTNAKSLFEAFIFQRSEIAPTTPVGGSFDFATNTLIPPNGWFLDIPEGSDPAWLSTGLFETIGDTGVDDSVVWTLPTKSFDNGLDGQPGLDGKSTYLFSVYKRQAEPAPAKPTGGSYDFGTNTPTVPAGWSEYIPAGNEPIWVSTTLASASGPTGIDDSLTWSDVVLLAQSGIDGIDGTAGKTTALLTIYQRSSGVVIAPTGGTFDFSTLTLTPPIGWSTNVPTGSDPLYATHAIASVVGQTGTDSDLTWEIPGIVAQNGEDGTIGKSFFEAFIFRRATSTPSIPTGGSFDFGNNVLTPPANWHDVPPEGTDPLYISTAIFSVVGDTGVDNSVDWSPPVLKAKSGIDGINGASVYQATIYKRSASGLSAPTGGSYNFGTNTLTPPTGWSKEVPAGTDPLYASVTTATSPDPTGLDDSLTWGTPEIMAKDGDKGDDGVSVYQYNIYRRSATELTTAPTGGSYDFGTKSGTPPTSWYNTIPSGTDPCYVSSSTASIVGQTGTDTTLTWTTPALLVKDGVDGLPGTPGTPGSPGPASPQYHTTRIWKEGTSAPAAPSCTITWATGALTLPAGWSLVGPTVKATGTTVAYFSDVTFQDATGLATSTTSTGSTPQRAINFDGIVTFTNGNTISDGTNDLAFSALATASSVDLASQVTGVLSVDNAAEDLKNSNITYSTLGNVPTAQLSGVAEAINTGTTTIDGAKITTGTIAVGTIDAGSGTFNVANIPNLNADKITAGTLDTARLSLDGQSVTIDPNNGQLIVAEGGISTTKIIEEAVTSVRSSYGNYSGVFARRTQFPTLIATDYYEVLKVNLSSYSGKPIIINGSVSARGFTSNSDAPRWVLFRLYIRNNTTNTLVLLRTFYVGFSSPIDYGDGGIIYTYLYEQPAINYVYQNSNYVDDNLDVILGVYLPSSTAYEGFISYPFIMTTEAKR